MKNITQLSFTSLVDIKKTFFGLFPLILMFLQLKNLLFPISEI